jgi:hypothetical protein
MLKGVSLFAAVAALAARGGLKERAQLDENTGNSHPVFGHLGQTFDYASIYHARRKSRRNKSKSRARACR